MRYQIDGELQPSIHADAFVAPSAAVIGDVVLEAGASVWFGAVLRGDRDRLRIGARSNIQDLSVVHTDPGIPVTVGRGVTVGHKVMLHGCTIGDHSLIGINAVVLNRAVIGQYCLIGANSLITEGKTIPDRSLVMGSPGKVIRELTDAEVDALKASAQNYVDNALRYRSSLIELGA